ncbi:hypothetical protein EWM64_g4023 [Hericium alpestre]|uniref:phosphoglycerate mutase (2,3-diphosphoglycerate-independent) n=1 Tax=Hericium alpestre TaxID=135208 RepID=A0A4Z0A0N2_9AGAM|nr:hypothetical protein EWM64_g4023 [Hericium alpestre]
MHSQHNWPAGSHEGVPALTEVGVLHIYTDFFGDSRDTAPCSATDYAKDLLALLAFIEKEKIGKIATAVGRYYAMDRDNEGEKNENIVAAIEEHYKRDETDKLMKPITVNGDEGRIKETKKYARVTFFSDGDVEKQFTDEKHHKISPKIATYDQQLNTSVQGIADKVAEVVRHTSVCNVAVQAVLYTDAIIGTVYKACQEAGHILLISADYSNTE